MASEWRVVIGLEADDPEDLADHLSIFHPAERHGILTLLYDSTLFGRYERQLYLDVAGADAQEAERAAIKLYEDARGHAGLETKSILLIGYSALDDLEPLHHRLMARAAIRMTDGYREEAIVLAQTACEVFARSVLQRLLQGSQLEPLSKRVPRSVHLQDPLTQGLFEVFAGQSIASSDWWPAYQRHYTRRNGIVHAGLSVTAEDAAESLDAARAFLKAMSGLESKVR